MKNKKEIENWIKECEIRRDKLYKEGKFDNAEKRCLFYCSVIDGIKEILKNEK